MPRAYNYDEPTSFSIPRLFGTGVAAVEDRE
jgi:hypothetical protein